MAGLLRIAMRLGLLCGEGGVQVGPMLGRELERLTIKAFSWKRLGGRSASLRHDRELARA